MMRKSLILIAVLLMLVLTSQTFVVNAVPPLPSSFYGQVKLNGENVPDGTLISAWIDGVKYTETPSLSYEGNSVYAFDVPGDESSTSEIVEGGVPGDIIVFKIGDLVADQTGIWTSGVYTELNLTIGEPAYRVYLPLILN